MAPADQIPGMIDCENGGFSFLSLILRDPGPSDSWKNVLHLDFWKGHPASFEGLTPDIVHTCNHVVQSFQFLKQVERNASIHCMLC